MNPTPLNAIYFEVSWFTLCAGLIVIALAVFAGCFFAGVHLASHFLGWRP